jgi:hypothetical protein
MKASSRARSDSSKDALASTHLPPIKTTDVYHAICESSSDSSPRRLYEVEGCSWLREAKSRPLSPPKKNSPENFYLHSEKQRVFKTLQEKLKGPNVGSEYEGKNLEEKKDSQKHFRKPRGRSTQ